MMSFPGDSRHTPGGGGGGGSGGLDPLQNLSTIQTRIDSVQKFLHNSVNNNTLIGKDQMEMVSAEITSAIHQIIVSGAALLASTQTQNNPETFQHQDNNNKEENHPKIQHEVNNNKEESEDYEIIELDAMELLAEHIHFCEICGKGFKRDANLRMHMRAHGDKFKTAEALSKPDSNKLIELRERSKTRFSCPFNGCNRNKKHKKFRPLKSVICVKNHFKRSHCPKMYSCTRCNNKSFSVMADLKSHLKHCGEVKWKCSCGTSFSRKDKLFGHMALFEGHMPAVMAEEDEAEAEESGKGVAAMVEMGGTSDGFLDGFELMDNYYNFDDVISSSNANNGFGFWD